MARKRLDSWYDLLVSFRFEKIAARAGLESLSNGAFAVVHRENEYFGPGRRFSDLIGRINAVENWQRDIKNDHVGRMVQRELDGLPPVGGLGTNAKIRTRLQKCAQAAAHHHMVIGQKDADHHPCSAPLSASPVLTVDNLPPEAECREPRIIHRRIRCETPNRSRRTKSIPDHESQG